MNPDKHQAMREHLATVVMGWVIYDRDPFWYRHKSTGEIAEQTSNWEPFTNHEQAFKCLDKFEQWGISRNMVDDGYFVSIVDWSESEPNKEWEAEHEDKLHAICIAMCKATGFEEQQRSE